MDQALRPTGNRHWRTQRPRRRHPVFNVIMGVLSAAMAFLAFIPGAVGPGFGDFVPAARVETASLSRSGTDVIITGSVNSMFETAGMFVGPNRAEKRDRARIVQSALEFVSVFNEARLQMASLRARAFSDAPVMAAAATPPAPAGPIPRADLAALGPLPDSPALSAISVVAPAAPVPVVLSKQLAYARADMPVTTFPRPVTDARGHLVSEKDLWCLAQAIYFEARGETYRGQVAVAQVVLNRLKHKLYPSTICGVVFQNQSMRNACQFSFACDGIPERVTDASSWKQANAIAKGAVSGALYLPEVGNATHYHAAYVYPAWAPRMKKITRIGLHIFYQFKSNWRFG